MGSLSPQKPIIIGAAYPLSGHTGGPLQVAGHLASRGYKVYFITGPYYKDSTEKLGITYVENNYQLNEKYVQERMQIPDLGVRIAEDLKHFFGDAIVISHQLLRYTLELVRAQHPDHTVVLLHEVMFMGLLPFVHGAPLPKGYTSLPPTINFATHNNPIPDPSLPPFGPGLPYDPTPENKALWKTIYDSLAPMDTLINTHWTSLMRPLGATRPLTGSFWTTVMTLGDVTVQPTSPSTEYPHPPTSHKFAFIGGLPLKPLSPSYTPPPWFSTLQSNSSLPLTSPNRKKVIFLTQGTVSPDYTQLILPGITALSPDPSLLVIATLGQRGASLSLPFAQPANVHIADYLPYDLILSHTDVFVSNGGYNSFMHGVMNGVPMVLAGMDADKGEVAARGEWCGVAVNLRSGTPEGEEIRRAVGRVLAEKRFKERAVELRVENERLGALGRVEGIIEGLVKGSIIDN
ncbi:glycosyltransferase [Podospora aff. communis PSN243]|uniref:Glycosyltransferase n=1 Tax=Podospora aff. communis PSN243 TaxID=3040156 RepID=A0AAV9H1E0_9PEZI|nr:glycosyltransferase [Podospora aff. communis PSN243]